MGNGVTCRVIDHAIAPDNRCQNAGALVRKQIESTLCIAANAQKFTPLVSLVQIKVGRQAVRHGRR